jgi:hypothetical protein
MASGAEAAASRVPTRLRQVRIGYSARARLARNGSDQRPRCSRGRLGLSVACRARACPPAGAARRASGNQASPAEPFESDSLLSPRRGEDAFRTGLAAPAEATAVGLAFCARRFEARFRRAGRRGAQSLQRERLRRRHSVASSTALDAQAAPSRRDAAARTTAASPAASSSTTTSSTTTAAPAAPAASPATASATASAPASSTAAGPRKGARAAALSPGLGIRRPEPQPHRPPRQGPALARRPEPPGSGERARRPARRRRAQDRSQVFMRRLRRRSAIPSLRPSDALGVEGPRCRTPAHSGL